MVEQAIWFLNSFWASGPEFGKFPDAAEQIWKYTHLVKEIAKEDTTLDEVHCARAFEALGRPMTVKDMRKAFGEFDIDGDKRVSLFEIYCRIFVVSWIEGMRNPQGDPSDLALIDQAQKEINDAQAALAAAEENKKLAEQAENIAKRAAKDAESSKQALQESEHAALGAEDSAKAALRAIDKALAEAEAGEGKCFAFAQQLCTDGCFQRMPFNEPKPQASERRRHMSVKQRQSRLRARPLERKPIVMSLRKVRSKRKIILII